MLRIFASLKVRLIWNSVRSKPSLTVAYAFVSLVSIAFAVGGAIAISTILPGVRRYDSAMTLFFLALFFGWILLPLVTFGTDDTLDPSKLALFPISGRQLILGLTVSSLISGPAVIAAIVFSGSVIRLAPHPLALALTVSCGVAELILCVVFSRLVVTSLSSLLRSRKGKDVGMIVMPFIGASYWIVRAFTAGTARSLGQAGHLPVMPWAVWVPPGTLARAASYFASSETWRGLELLGVGVIEIVAGAFLWKVALSKNLSMPTASSEGPRTTKQDNPLTPRLLGRPLGRLAHISDVVAIFSKECKHAWRDPRRKATWIQSVIMGVAIPLGFVISKGGGSHSPRLVLAAALVPAFQGINFLNALGMDGKALWIDVFYGQGLDRTLMGKNIAQFTVGLVTTVPAALFLAAYDHGWEYAVPAILLGACVGLVMMGIGNVTSVLAPIPLPNNPNNVFSSPSGGAGCAGAFVQLGSFFLSLICAAPAAVAVIFTAAKHPAAIELVAILTTVYGAVFWRIGLQIARSRISGREARVLELLAG